MKRAIQLAERAETPFAAVLLNPEGEIILEAVNTTKKDGPLAHAEMNLIQKAYDRGVLDKAETLVTTCEPCSMCMSAIAWTNLNKVVYAVSIKMAANYLPQILIHAEEVAQRSFREIEVRGPILELVAEELFRTYTNKE